MRHTTTAFQICLSSLFLLSMSSMAETNLSISASVAPSPAVINGTTYFYANISNFGSDAAQEVIVSSTLASGLNLVNASTTDGSCSAAPIVSCNLGTIEAGSLSVQSTVSLEVTSGIVGSLSALFSIASSTTDSDTSNNSATATAEIVALSDSADLSIAYAYSADSVVVNDIWETYSYPRTIVTYPLLIVNNGPAAVAEVSVNLSIPLLSLVSFISATASQGNCETALNQCAGNACLAALELPVSVDCELGALSSGEVATIDIIATAAAKAGDTLHSSSYVHSNITADSDWTNNSTASTLQILAELEPSCGDQCPAGTIGIGCFIATAAYGSDMEEEVKLLRQFRDEKLLPYPWGQHFVSAYYRYSPPVANFISQHDLLRMLVRTLLTIPVMIIRYPLAILLASFIFILLTCSLMLSRRKKRGQNF